MKLVGMLLKFSGSCLVEIWWFFRWDCIRLLKLLLLSWFMMLLENIVILLGWMLLMMVF